MITRTWVKIPIDVSRTESRGRNTRNEESTHKPAWDTGGPSLIRKKKYQVNFFWIEQILN